MTAALQTTLYAYRHRAQSGKVHLRVQQRGEFSEPLKEHLHRVGTPARWLPAELAWDYPYSQAAVRILLERVNEVGVLIEWEDGLREVAELNASQTALEHAARVAIERIIRDPSIPLDPYPYRPVKPDGTPCPPLRHQQVCWHWSQRVRGLALWWDPGTGKTRAGIDAAGGWYRMGLINPMAYKPSPDPQQPHGVRGGVLVVCPKSMILTWQREAALWQSMQALAVVGTAPKKRRAAATLAPMHVINYEGLKFVIHNEYDAVIFDEIHWLANATDRTEYAQTLVLPAKKVLGLSGTPVSKDLDSVFFPSLLVDGGKALGPSLTAFREKYFNAEPVRAKHGPRVKYAAKDDAAAKIAAATAEFSYHVRKSDAGIDLPEKTFRPIYLEMTDDQRRYYDQLKREAVLYIEDATVTAEQAAKRIMKLWQLCQGFILADSDDDAGGDIIKTFTNTKEEALIESLRTEFVHRKVLVWAYFKAEIRRLCEVLTRMRIPHASAHGDVPQRQRDAAVDAWNKDPNLRVFVRQYSMSEGVTMHAAECAVPCADCIYLGWSWRLVDWLQSQDRIHRIGQKWPCSYSVLMTDCGIDRQMYERVLSRAEVGENFVNLSKDFYLSLLGD